MAEVASRPPATSTGSRAISDTAAQSTPPPPPSTAAPATKKGKGKKAANDPNDAARQLQAKIAQLEQDKAGKTEEDAEIGPLQRRSVDSYC